MTMTMKIFYLTMKGTIIRYKMSHLYKLQNGLETIIMKNYFVAFIVATSMEINSNQIFVLLWHYMQHSGEIS